jgi:hypothetical protein
MLFHSLAEVVCDANVKCPVTPASKHGVEIHTMLPTAVVPRGYSAALRMDSHSRNALASRGETSG